MGNYNIKDICYGIVFGIRVLSANVIETLAKASTEQRILITKTKLICTHLKTKSCLRIFGLYWLFVSFVSLLLMY